MITDRDTTNDAALRQFEEKFRDCVLTVIAAKQRAMGEYLDAMRLPAERRPGLEEWMNKVYQEETAGLLEFGDMLMIHGCCCDTEGSSDLD